MKRKHWNLFFILALIFALVIPRLAFAAKGGNSTTNQGSTPNGKPFQFMQSQMEALRAEIEALIGDVDSLEDWLIGAEAAILTLEEQTTGLQTQIDSNDGDIVSLQTQIDHNLELIGSLENEINQINEAMATHQTILSGQCPNGEYLQYVFPNGNIACAADQQGSGGINNVWISQQRVWAWSGWFWPGQYRWIPVYCQAGWTMTSVGWYSSIWALFPIRHTVTNTSAGEAYGVNTHQAPNWFYGVATCIKINTN